MVAVAWRMLLCKSARRQASHEPDRPTFVVTAQLGSERSVEKQGWAGGRAKKLFKDRIKHELSAWWRRRRGAKGRGVRRWLWRWSWEQDSSTI